MKFAHIADCHIGGWREPALRDVSAKAFSLSISTAINEKVDFILIAGDLFNTAQPGMDPLKSVVEDLARCREAGLAVYIIPGSHDYSPSGKTMIDILEAAGLCVQTCRGQEADGKLRLAFVTDSKTGVKICGIVGRKAGLDSVYFDNLDLEYLEAEPGDKIFMFHCAVTDWRPAGYEHMESIGVSSFPKGFKYYAGGHIHIIDHREVPGFGLFGIPGPTFPNSFSELEELSGCGVTIVEDWKVKRTPINLHPVVSVKVDAHGSTPSSTKQKILQSVPSKLEPGSVVTLRIEGTLIQGRVGDINWNEIETEIISRGAHCVLRNCAKLTTPELEPVQITANSVEEIENRLITEHAGKVGVFEPEKEGQIIRGLMQALCAEKLEGENQTVFEDRIVSACKGIFSGDLDHRQDNIEIEK